MLSNLLQQGMCVPKPSVELRAPVPPQDDQRVAYYKLKAQECREIALAASADAREEWLQLANQWTYLALRSGAHHPEIGFGALLAAIFSEEAD